MAITFTNHGLPGDVLLDDGEGTYAFEAPDFGPVPIVEEMADGIGGIPKEASVPPAPFRLTLRFVVPLAQVASIRNRIAAARQVIAGTLMVPDEGAVTNCLIVDARRGPQQRVEFDGRECQRMVYVLSGLKVAP